MLDVIKHLIVEDHLRQINEYDVQTFLHCVRVNRLSMTIGERLGMTADLLEDLYVASVLHDYGKIFIPDKLLLQQHRFSLAEQRIAQLHVELGCQRLSGSIAVSKRALCGIQEHHERLDGSGYPHHLTNISDIGRILGVVDVYDAMTHKRCYKGSCSSGYSINEIKKGKCVLYDENIVEALSEIVAIGYDDSLADNDEFTSSSWFSVHEIQISK